MLALNGILCIVMMTFVAAFAVSNVRVWSTLRTWQKATTVLQLACVVFVYVSWTIIFLCWIMHSNHQG